MLLDCTRGPSLRACAHHLRSCVRISGFLKRKGEQNLIPFRFRLRKIRSLTAKCPYWHFNRVLVREKIWTEFLPQSSSSPVHAPSVRNEVYCQ